MLNPRSAVLALALACLCAAGNAGEKLTYGDVAGRLYDLQRLAEPPAAGETSGNWSSFDRGAKYNRTTGKYEKWDSNRDGGGFIRKESGGVVYRPMSRKRLSTSIRRRASPTSSPTKKHVKDTWS